MTFFPTPRNEKFTISLASIPTIWRMPLRAGPLPAAPAARPRVLISAVLIGARPRHPQVARVSATSLRIFLVGARKSRNRHDRNLSAAQTLKCRYRFLLKRRLRE